MINLYSLGHLLQWFIIGRYLIKSWALFFLLSLGWEVIELYLPFEFAKEDINNKLADIFVNYVGFYIGTSIKKQATQKNTISKK